MPKVPPKKEVCISLQYLEKHVGDEVDFLLADKLLCLSAAKDQLHLPLVSQDIAKMCKLLILGTLGFLQVDNVTFGV